MSSPNIPTTQLETSFRRLRQRWEESKQLWNDPVQQNFEKHYWNPLTQETTATLREMKQLTNILEQVHQRVGRL